MDFEHDITITTDEYPDDYMDYQYQECEAILIHKAKRERV